MKVLNIDALAQAKRQIKMNGRDHDVLETSVQKFIDNLKAAENLEAARSEPLKLSEQMEKTIDTILESVPTMPREDLTGKPIEMLTVILNFLRGELDPDGANANAKDNPIVGDGEGPDAKKPT